MEVYTLESAGAPTALPILRQAFPEATFSVGADAKNLIAWARPDEQTLIKMAVEQIEAAGSPNDNRVMAVYPMRYEDTASLLRVLEPVAPKACHLRHRPEARRPGRLGRLRNIKGRSKRPSPISRRSYPRRANRSPESIIFNRAIRKRP